ncbi:Spore maturation protein CgeB [Desulfonatronum thiosulfatophilum]|uniref:Spore maturation protein CgeB n=1 Tax=Desulfonatronum thiosulfatophilum TaxID=617002 RepID=A0A1G6DIU9_9BACT|nr:glycosyltransferase [Desulfonatronum thiosulfatophilum]SDB45056.1 Spore maturation protein CgeB [Desulfonatronum thiosulfatophilum]
MRICMINCALQDEFSRLGHEILALHPEPGLYDFPSLLEKHAFEPDVVVQQETLGPRVLLQGLGKLSCLKIYWSIDTHLNSFWQEEYSRLFDLTCSTQKQWARYLQDQGACRTAWLPWFGRRLPWYPWSSRKHNVGFVGRVTRHRPSRERFVAFLGQCYNLRLTQDVSFQQMLEIYQETRLAPNESIFGEINFRLFEAASCGCLVLNPAPIPGLEELFTPEREIGVFRHALELGSMISSSLNNLPAAEKMAKAAWVRVQEEHLPAHRAKSLLALIEENLSQFSKKSCDSSDLDWAMTLYRLWQARRAPVSGQTLLHLLLALPESPRKRCALLGFWMGMDRRDMVAHDLAAIFQANLHAEDHNVNRTASLAALHLEDLPMAKAFWLRLRARSPRLPRPPGTQRELYLAWARDLQRQGRLARPGLSYDHQRHVPESALECLILAHLLDSRDMDICRAMDALLDKQPGFEPLRLSLLSHITLHRPQDWLAGLKLGLVNLQGFRLEEGLEELFLAGSRAAQQNQDRKFFNALSAADPDRSIRTTLHPRPDF